MKLIFNILHISFERCHFFFKIGILGSGCHLISYSCNITALLVACESFHCIVALLHIFLCCNVTLHAAYHSVQANKEKTTQDLRDRTCSCPGTFLKPCSVLFSLCIWCKLNWLLCYICLPLPNCFYLPRLTCLTTNRLPLFWADFLSSPRKPTHIYGDHNPFPFLYMNHLNF